MAGNVAAAMEGTQILEGITSSPGRAEHEIRGSRNMTNDSKGKKQHRFLAALLGTTLLCGGVVFGFSASGAMTPQPISVPQPPKLPSFANLVAAVKPAVVNISTTQEVKTSKFQLPENGPLNDMLQKFLGPDWQKQLQQQSQQPAHALGSGFIIDPAGYVVTKTTSLMTRRTSR
jgi:serine protease Do